MKYASTSLLLAVAVAMGACARSDDPTTLVASAKEYIAKRDYKASIIQLKNALQKDPDNREARYLLGLAAFENGDLATAEIELKKALDLGLDTDDVNIAFARVLLAKGEPAMVVSQFGGKALSTSKSRAELRAVVGSAELRRNRQAQAEAAFKESLVMDPANVAARLGVARLAASRQDWKNSLAGVEAALATKPADPEALLLKADLLAVQGEGEPATRTYRAAIEAAPNQVPARLSLISHLMRERSLDAAQAELDALRKVAPQDLRYSYARAMLQIEQRKYAEARESIQHVLKSIPEHVPSLTLAGMAAFETGAYAEAESHLRKAVFKAPDLVIAKRLLAATHLRMGQTDVAMNEVRDLLERAGKDPNILALAAETHLASGDVTGAAQFYERAKKLVPANVRVQTRLAQIRFAAGDPDRGFAELEAAAASSNDDYQADLALITTHLRQRQADKALAAIAKLEKKQPENPLTHNLRGVALLLKNDHAKARASFERALQLGPSYMPAVGNLARLDLRDKKPDLAKKRYEEVLKKEPKNEQALLGLAVLLRVTGASPQEIEKVLKQWIAANPASPNARSALVNYYLRARDFKAALVTAQEGVAALPNVPAMVEALGMAQLAANDNRQAISTLTRLAEMQPKSHQPHLLLASAHMQAKQPEEAIKALRAALVLRPDLASAQRDIAAIYVGTGRAEQAIKEARTVQSENPKQPFGWALEGEIHIAQKNWTEAERVYRTALKKFDLPALAARVHAVMEAGGKAKEADALADQWVAAHPKDAFLLNYLAEHDLLRRQYERAAQRYQAALKRSPDNPMILNNLAWVSNELKQPNAVEYAERAHELAPDNPSVMDTLGGILVATGETDRGLELLGRAAELAPQSYNIRLNFAKALIKANRKEPARKELEALAKLDNRNPVQQEAAKLLQTL